MTLQTKFQELITLTLCVGDWEIGFSLAIGGADDVCRFVYATLKFACLVSVTDIFYRIRLNIREQLPL